MMIQQQYKPAWEEKASLVPFVMQGTQVGYTSFLRGPSQKFAMAHFHVENNEEIAIL